MLILMSTDDTGGDNVFDNIARKPQPQKPPSSLNKPLSIATTEGICVVCSKTTNFPNPILCVFVVLLVLFVCINISFVCLYECIVCWFVLMFCLFAGSY